MMIGTELDDERFGLRVVKSNVPVSIKFSDETRKGSYYGEWS